MMHFDDVCKLAYFCFLLRLGHLFSSLYVRTRTVLPRPSLLTSDRLTAHTTMHYHIPLRIRVRGTYTFRWSYVNVWQPLRPYHVHRKKGGRAIEGVWLESFSVLLLHFSLPPSFPPDYSRMLNAALFLSFFLLASQTIDSRFGRRKNQTGMPRNQEEEEGSGGQNI